MGAGAEQGGEGRGEGVGGVVGGVAGRGRVVARHGGGRGRREVLGGLGGQRGLGRQGGELGGVDGGQWRLHGTPGRWRQVLLVQRTGAGTPAGLYLGLVLGPGQVRAGRLLPAQLGLDGVGGGGGGAGPAPGPRGVVVVVPRPVGAHLMVDGLWFMVWLMVYG